MFLITLIILYKSLNLVSKKPIKRLKKEQKIFKKKKKIFTKL